MTDCLVVQPIARCGLDLLRSAGLSVFEAPAPELAVLRPHLATAQAIITRNHGLSSDEIGAAPRLRIIASHGTGTDRIDKAAAHRRSIAVVNTPGTNAQAVAEHALALMLALSRQILASDAALRRGNWAHRDHARPIEISERCLGLVGYGHVARRLARMALGIGMHVTTVSRHASDDDLRKDGVTRAQDLDALLATSDIVSLHGLPGDRPLVTASRLKQMRPQAILVNTARGTLVDEAALVDVLRDGLLAGAALDVFADEPLPPDSPLLGCPNLILTPHLGGLGPEASRRTALAVARLVIEGLGLDLPEGDAGGTGCP